MLNENIVSLLIPCYNGEQFVERCLINVIGAGICTIYRINFSE